jgi:L-alanine-DL-glutamate epimerase-like enolase superfamily enzyme
MRGVPLEAHVYARSYGAWDWATATAAIALLEPLKLRWLEEPARWADHRRELQLLS